MWDWDEPKRQANLAKHGVDFAAIAGFDWLSAEIWMDERFDYGEDRKAALGMVGARLYFIAYTERGATRRLISLRKANERERQRWSTPEK